MRKTNIMALGALIATTSAVAGTEVDALKDRITALEDNKSKIEINGTIEASYQNDRTEGETLVDTLELNITANLTENLNANLVLKSEADGNGDLPTNRLVDEATLNGNIRGVGFTVGKFGAPFGVYETVLVSDPVGKGIGDTGGVKGVVLSTEINGVTLSAWSGNSKNNGLSIGYEGDNFALGIDTIRDAAADTSGGATDTINNKGIAIHGQATFDNTTVIIEQIKVDADTTAQEDGKLTQVELNHVMGDWTFAVSQNKGTTTNGTKDDTKTNAYGVSYAIAEGASLTVESNKEKDAKRTTSVKLAYEF
ncbi:hypothetical protein BPUTSESOX_1916 [uncultured Gammaproteobacteria bacterium]|jgi:hypothetical protein|nr:hypothetical protein [uncultured Gammaproteobacteria bacterium]VVH51110.1 hypothetical protein BPUTSESOX_1916 [uncultured Gammaproteobacteria bacterium]